MASINLKNKSKADLVALVRMSGVMPISHAQRMTKAELISRLEQLEDKLTVASPNEAEANKKDPKVEEDVLLHSAPGRLAARQHNSTSKQATSNVTERRSVLVASEEPDPVEKQSSRRSVMAIPEDVDPDIEAKKTASTAPVTKTRTRRSAMVASDEHEETPDALSEEIEVDTARETKVSRSRQTKSKTDNNAKKSSSPSTRGRVKKDDDKASEDASQVTATEVEAKSDNKKTSRADNAKPTTAARAAGRSRKTNATKTETEKATDNESINQENSSSENNEAVSVPAKEQAKKATVKRTNSRRKKSEESTAEKPEHETVGDKTEQLDVADRDNSTKEASEKSKEITPSPLVEEAESVDTEKSVDTASQKQARQSRHKTRSQIQQKQGRALRSSNEKTDESKTETEQPAASEEQEDKKKTEASSRERRQIDSGEVVSGVMEIMPDGYGFLRRDNYLHGPKDIYIPPQFIRRFNLREGDLVTGPTRVQRDQDRYQALYYINSVNGLPPEQMIRRPHFDRLTPIYPNERYTLETTKQELSTRIIDLISPIGKGQRGMIVSPPKAGKTILLQKIANAISINNPDSKLIVLLIDERPEEVTDMQRSIKGEVVYSTFDKTPENHVKITELVLERAMRLVEIGEDVIILMDSLTRMARAYNLTINPTGRTLSGGLDPGALYGPKRFFGAARNIENGGSLTIVATALIDTGSRMDEVIFEEFKGTGNMEVYLDRKLSEKRIFPAIDVNKSSTRREELLLSEQELEAVWSIRKAFGSLDSSNVTETIMNLLMKTNDNRHFVSSINVSLNNKSLYESMKPSGSKSSGQNNNNNNNHGV